VASDVPALCAFACDAAATGLIAAAPATTSALATRAAPINLLMADSSLIQMSEITGSNLASFKATLQIETGPQSTGLLDRCAKLSRSPAMPVTMVMAMMPAVPPMMVTMPPMHFRGRQPGVVLNRRGGAGIAERQRIGALGWSCERQQCANGGEPKNFRERHECSPWVGCPRLRRIARRNAARKLTPAT
jgi:hypothetical protein